MYFEICGVPITSTDGLPQHICVFCWALLKKSSDFRQKCKASNTLLASHLIKIHALTTSYIETLDRSNLNTSLELMNILQCNCVPDDTKNILDKETADNLPSRPEEGLIDDEIDTQNDSLSRGKKRKNIQKARIEDFKNKHFTKLMDSDKELFYYYILKKYLTKSQSQLNNHISKINLDIDDTIDHKLLDDVEHWIIQAEVNNVIKICNNIQNTSQNRLFEYINKKYVERNILPVKQKPLKDLKWIKERRMRKGSQTTKSLAKFSKDFNFNILLMLKEDIIKDVLMRKESEIYKNAEYRCELCFMGFGSENTFQNHKAIHDPRLPYECEFCHVRSKNSTVHRRHLSFAHRYKFVCRQCGQVKRSITRAREHYRSHAGASYLCEHCGQTFRKQETRVNHIRIQHGRVPCDTCHLLFATETGLVTHKAKAHRECFKCAVCLVQFHNENALRRHAELTAQNCGKHVRPCTRCGDSFSDETTLKRHMLDNHPPDRWRPINVGPVRHRRNVDKREYTCEICFRGGFKNLSSLRKHTQRFHSNQRPYQCDHCGKTFKDKPAITRHMRVHVKLRPVSWSCADCDMTFKLRKQLFQHFLAHSTGKASACEK
ncbi:hypothetical protein O0L34_g10683 [Tuta absoluta]|nr:hypothetical protein O0L34_g10683 [Tuta absoluta]